MTNNYNCNPITSYMENKTCKHCKNTFQILDEDLKFYEQVSPTFNGQKYLIPSPTLCPDCRQQRRLSFRNERTLYRRKCDGTGEDIISVFSEKAPFPVYDNKYWFSDNWNPLDYGRDFDFNRPFFEQFEELMNSVPQLARSSVSNYNSDFTNQSGYLKNCYLTFEADYCENCLYCNNAYDSKTCLDCYHIVKCELCYDCLNCQNCYNLQFSENCNNCSDSKFLKNCIGCKNCINCVNLRNKSYYFENQKYPKEDFERISEDFQLKTRVQITEEKEQFKKYVQNYPEKYFTGVNNEDSTGDYLYNTKNCLNCSNVTKARDCKYVYDSRSTNNVYDMTVFGSIKTVEFCYEVHELGLSVKNVIFTDQAWEGCSNLTYCKLCIKNCRNLFGCVGLQHQEYCIFNKKYSKEEYEKLAAKITEHMIKTPLGGASTEWGEFFPTQRSPFAYNETMAQFYFPLTKEAAGVRGYKWMDTDPKEYLPQQIKLPETVEQIDDSILNQILACQNCSKNYKLIEEELRFYKQHDLPPPEICHDCRHKQRFMQKNSRKLFERNCANCSKSISTSYSPDRPEQILCEECFLQATE